MNFLSSLISHQKIFKFSFLLLQCFSILIIFISGCSSTKRFSNEENSKFIVEANFIRVLIHESTDDLIINVNSQILLSNSEKRLAKINEGNRINVSESSGTLRLSISNKDFVADTFYISGSGYDEIIKIDGKKYRGQVKIFLSNSQIKIVNQVGLEDYVKGVITKEMPVGKGNENYEALKAFSICVRTYALLKISENKNFFDIYNDTRDQVYGGVDGETSLTNRIVDETRGQILSYDNKPATIFYHSTCGGYTEDVKNVFRKNNLPYLISIKDSSEPYCSIAPHFNWKEEYSEKTFISRLYDAKLISTTVYNLKSLSVLSRFESGRVNELGITLVDKNQAEQTLTLVGNSIRSVIKTFDGKSILRSTLFDISLEENNKVVISGKGNGHGVGLCQWGAIGQSKQGIDYRNILNHYFPGTKIIKYYD